MQGKHSDNRCCSRSCNDHPKQVVFCKRMQRAGAFRQRQLVPAFVHCAGPKSTNCLLIAEAARKCWERDHVNPYGENLVKARSIKKMMHCTWQGWLITEEKHQNGKPLQMYKPEKQIQVIVIDTVEGRHIQTICIQYTPPPQRSIFIFTEMH